MPDIINNLKIFVKMKTKFFLFLTSLLILASCAKENALVTTTENLAKDEPMSVEAINRTVEAHLQNTNTVFNWNEHADAFMVWSALENSNQVMSIGYKPANEGDLTRKMHEINIKSSEWLAAKNKVINAVLDIESKTNPDLTAEKIINSENETLPYMQVKVTSLETIEALRQMPEVRYAEPSGYDPLAGTDLRSDAGCGVSPNYNIPSSDYVNASPGSKIPWNFYHSNIPAAWSHSTGDNVTVGLIDTGISDNQNKLGSRFNDGYSSGRFIYKYSTKYSGMWWWKSLDAPHDQCGHGTQMAGLIAAPRSNEGNAIGVAYNCNMRAYRGTEDVVVNGSSEIDGVSDAMIALANRSDVKVLSMSIGDVFYHGQWADAVYYTYNRGKMIISAAGTSLTWTSWYGVIFPASMSQTVAVTGIRDNYTQRCNTCHDGSAVDFTVVMQRASDTDRTSLTLTMSGNTPTYVGGSSCATATTAGIAALIWAKNLNQSRSTVLQKMKNASQYYPSRHSSFGYGVIDALDAVTQ